MSVGKAGKYSEKGIVLVPGKLLSEGIAEKGMQVACLSASEKAREKVEKAGGKILSLEEAKGKTFIIIS